MSARMDQLSDPELRVSLEYPSDWQIQRPAAGSLVLVRPHQNAWLRLTSPPMSCAAAQAHAAAQRPPNVYVVGESRRALAGQEATQVQIIDSISMIRETSLFVPREGGCLLLEYGVGLGGGAAEAEQELDAILASVQWT